jgi:hypothetical protein
MQVNAPSASVFLWHQSKGYARKPIYKIKRDANKWIMQNIFPANCK